MASTFFFAQFWTASGLVVLLLACYAAVWASGRQGDLWRRRARWLELGLGPFCVLNPMLWAVWQDIFRGFDWYWRYWDDPVHYATIRMRFGELVSNMLPGHMVALVLAACYASGWCALYYLILGGLPRSTERPRLRSSIMVSLILGVIVNLAGLLTLIGYGLLTPCFLAYLVPASAHWRRLRACPSEP